MHQKYLVLTLFVALVTFSSHSQEYHWTLYNMSPLSVNPAKTGDFYGTFRIGGIFRNQFSGAATKSYNTPMIYSDIPLIKGFRDSDWIGVGGMMWQDKAGQLGLKNTGVYFSAAYHLALNKKGTSFLSAGFQSGSISRKIDELNPDVLIFEDELVQGGVGSSVDRNKISTNGESVVEYAGGIMLKVPFGKETRFQTGLRVGHLSNNMNLAVAGGTDRLPKRITGHAKLETPIADGIILIPSVLYDSFDPASEFLGQVEAKFLINPEKETDVSVGLGYRASDAVQFLAGMTVRNINVGIGFDLTTSGLADSSVFGGFEIGVTYIAKIYKEPQVDPVIFCPRF